MNDERTRPISKTAASKFPLNSISSNEDVVFFLSLSLSHSLSFVLLMIENLARDGDDEMETKNK
jgi:hypothetical protein